MATDSFLCDIGIKDKNSGRKLIEALEKTNAIKSSLSKVAMTCREVTGKDIRALLGKSKGCYI